MTDTPDKTVFSKSHREHLSQAMRGKTKTPEHKAKIAESMRRKHREAKLKQD